MEARWALLVLFIFNPVSGNGLPLAVGLIPYLLVLAAVAIVYVLCLLIASLCIPAAHWGMAVVLPHLRRRPFAASCYYGALGAREIAIFSVASLKFGVMEIAPAVGWLNAMAVLRVCHSVCAWWAQREGSVFDVVALYMALLSLTARMTGHHFDTAWCPIASMVCISIRFSPVACVQKTLFIGTSLAHVRVSK
jgi:hypothetical protein